MIMEINFENTIDISILNLGSSQEFDFLFFFLRIHFCMESLPNSLEIII